MAIRKAPPTLPAGFDFDRDQAAAYIGVTVNTLGAWAAQRKNIPFIRTGGRTWYRKADLDAYLRRRIVRVV